MAERTEDSECAQSTNEPARSLSGEIIPESEQTEQELPLDIANGQDLSRCHMLLTGESLTGNEKNVVRQSNDKDFQLENLASTALSNYISEQRRVKKQLADITESQRVILETLQQENAKFVECQVLHEVSEVMNKARIYQIKLVNIKREMLSLHEKSAELKRRALVIQQEKQREALQKEQQREIELEKERKLTAKLATKPSTSIVTSKSNPV